MKNFFKSKIVLASAIPILIIVFVIALALDRSHPAVVAEDQESAQPGQMKNVLLLNSYDQSYKWTAEITKTVQDRLDASGLPYSLEVENMDTKRLNDDTSKELLYQSLKYKFSKFKYDVVLTSDDDALNFVLKHRDEILPGVPVVFCGTNFLQNRIEILEGQKLISGVNEDSDIEASLDAGLALSKNVKNIYFIHDNTTTGKIVGGYIDKLLPEYQKNYKVTVYDGSLSGEEIVENIKNIPKDSLIYITIFNQDGKGHYFTYSELLKEISKVTDVPIYGTWNFNLGDGIVGGKLIFAAAQGGAMADIAARVLKGENIENIPVLMQSPNVYAFDYRELALHGISEDDLPEGSVVINLPETFYAKYKEFVWVGTSVVILMIAIIVILGYVAYFRQMRIRQQVELQQKLEKTVAERTADLTSANKSLEIEVEERKKVALELVEKNKDLEEFSRIVVDREMKMMELKNRIRELEGQTPIAT